MADMYTELSACRSYLYKIARDADKREPTNHECAGLVLYCAERATKIALDAIQILGGNGYSKCYAKKYQQNINKINKKKISQRISDGKICPGC